MKPIAVGAFAIVALMSFGAAAPEPQQEQQEQPQEPQEQTAPLETEQPDRQALVPLTAPDQAFLEDAYQGGLAEIQIGRLAQVMSRDPTFKNFGRTLEEDHTRLNRDLATIAKRHGFTLSNRLRPEDRQDLTRLMGLRDVDFENAFKEKMVSDHEEDLDAFRQVADQADSDDVATAAGRAVPTLENHLSIARSLVPGRTVLYGDKGD